jgi:SYP5 family syntaxin
MCCHAAGEEVDLHTRLLDELDEDVDVTHTRLRAATKRIKQVMRNISNCRGGFIIFVLIITLVVVTIIAFKLTRLFKPW